MALNLVVDDIEAVAEGLRSEYEEKEGKWHLKVEGLEDTSGLKKQRDELLAEKKAAQAKAKEAEELARKAAEENARKTGDLKTLEESLNTKFSSQISELQEQVKTRDGMILGGKKDSLIAELSGMFVNPAVAKLMLTNLVHVEYGEGGAIVQKFTGLDGKPVTTDPQEFAKHLSGVKDFAPLIKASNATGGGANGSGNGNGGANTISRSQFAQLSPGQQMDHIKAGGKVS